MTEEEFNYEEECARREYERYLSKHKITAEEHERELGEWLDAQD